MGKFMKELRSFMNPHYLVNIVLGVSFFVLKTTSPFCEFLFDDCELQLREWELLTFLGCIIVMKNRKQPSYKVYVGTVCMFAKLLSTFLYVQQSPLYAGIYVILCFMHIAFLPEPSYAGPDFITYFRGVNLEDELKRDPRVTWLVEFYAAWSPNCVQFASVFAEMSAKYNLDNLKFGKIDATRFPQIAEKYNINCSSWSRQLPTLILFQGGKETKRRPGISNKGQVLAKFVFNEENVVRDFELNDLYLQCKKNPLHKKKKDKIENEENVAEVKPAEAKKNE